MNIYFLISVKLTILYDSIFKINENCRYYAKEYRAKLSYTHSIFHNFDTYFSFCFLFLRTVL